MIAASRRWYVALLLTLFGAASPVRAQLPAAQRDSASIRALDSSGVAFVIRVDSLERAAIQDLTDVLSARVPGVLVQESSGTTGTAARIWIRGPGSLMLGNAPLLIVDGVRISSTAGSTLAIGGQLPSRLDDISIEDIQTIEVLRGPATASLYGTGAAGGVIRVTTKRGLRGRPRVQAFAETGLAREVTQFPLNYRTPGVATGSGMPFRNCNLDDRIRRLCTPNDGGLVSFNPLEQASPFRDGLRQRYGANITGGSNRLRYFASGSLDREEGVLEVSDLNRKHVRLNLDARFRGDLKVALASSYLSGISQYPLGDNSDFGVLVAGLVGDAADDPIRRGYEIALKDLFAVETVQEIGKYGVALTADWSPLPWLSVVAQGGVDRNDSDDKQSIPAQVYPPTTRRAGSQRHDRMNVGVSGDATYLLRPGFRARSRVGIERIEAESREEWWEESGPLGDPFVRQGVMSLLETRILGVYLDQRIAWRDRWLFDAGLRRDDPERGDGSSLYPSARISWLMHQEPFFRAMPALEALRVHLAYGRSGQPPAGLPVFFVPIGTAIAQPKLERTAEVEAGISATLLHDRVNLSLAYYQKTTTDALAPTPLPPSSGYFGIQFRNVAEVRNSGFETSLHATLVDGPNLSFTLGLGAWTNVNELVSNPFSPVLLGVSGIQRIEVGYPLGGFWQRRILNYADLDSDGIISRVNCPGQTPVAGGPACEITLSDAVEYLGSPFPRRAIAVTPTMTLGRAVKISALLDYRGGFAQYNATESARCSSTCRGLNDPSAPLGEQARAVAQRLGTRAGYIEDGTFWKLREVAVSFQAPASWAGRIGGSAATFSIAGRNLATWTNYSGFDPEINGAGPLGLAQADLFTQPSVRHYTARLSIGW